MQDIVGDAGTPLIILFAAVGSVLIIGCANVTGLMMARAMERQREVAIRTAVGGDPRPSCKTAPDRGCVRSLPLAEGAFMELFLKEGEGREDSQSGRRFEYQVVTDGYFDAAGIDIVGGRGFSPTDLPTAPRVAIVNEALARQHFQGEDVIGQRIRILASNPDTEEFEIVGIAGDVLQDSVDSPAPAQIYVPHAQATEYVTGATRSLAIALRTEPRRQAGIVEAIRDTVWDLGWQPASS